jgi:microcompartment protein CcmK/EutM
MPSVSIIKSRALNEDQVPLLVGKLESHLPYSLPLLRRIQFHLQRERASTTARIFVAAVHAASAGDREGGVSSGSGAGSGEHEDDNHQQPPWEDLDAWFLEPQSLENPWIAAHVDLVNAGQTQVWVFGSWEAAAAAASPSSGNEVAFVSADTGANADPDPDPVHKRLLHALFTHISRELIPLLPTTAPEEWLDLARTRKYLSRPYSRDKVIFGTVSDKLWTLFPERARTRTDAGYWKYLFDASASPSPSPTSNPTSPAPPLPLGYRFGPMHDRDLQTVLDRTPIPRTLGTLRQLVSVGLFHEESECGSASISSRTAPVGWGFLGKDASLSSLHTEVEHRGKGLAVALGAELLRLQQEQQQQQQQQQCVVAVDSQGEENGAGVVGEGGGAAEEEKENNNNNNDDDARVARTTSTSRSWWGHADVSQHNIASQRVMEKLGGRPAWKVMWTEMDMRVLLALALEGRS